MNLKTHIRENLWLAISNSYEAENYRHAIVDAMHRLTDIIREKSGLDGDGLSLVGQAFGGKSPPVKVSKLQTQTERDEQKGIEQILRGLYQAVRNPRSHEQMEDSKDTADAIIYFINYLLDIIAESEEPFTIPKFLERVFDPRFVESDDYAEVLLEQIPEKKRLHTVIEIFRHKTEGDGEKLKYMLGAILSRLLDDETVEFLSIVSEELGTTQDTASIQLTLEILPSHLWPRIERAAKLRIENELIESIEEGRYNPRSCSVESGDLGTWAVGLVTHFDLQPRLREVLLRKLRSCVLSSGVNWCAHALSWTPQLPPQCTGARRSGTGPRTTFDSGWVSLRIDCRLK